MTDREMLELAAKAYTGDHCFGFDSEGNALIDPVVYSPFNPLNSDGDALRLAVKLGLCITPYPIYSETKRHYVIVKQRRRTDLMREGNPTEVGEAYGDDPFAATRRAITRAAAEIRRGM